MKSGGAHSHVSGEDLDRGKKKKTIKGSEGGRTLGTNWDECVEGPKSQLTN